MPFPAESPPGPVPGVEFSTPSTWSGTSLVETPDNADIVSWAPTTFPDTFPALPSHQDLHFKDIDGCIVYDYKHNEIEIVSKVLHVGIYDSGDQNSSENFDVYACIDPSRPGMVSFLHEKENGRIYQTINTYNQTHICFEYPFTDVGKKGDFEFDTRRPLNALIHYYILAERAHQFIAPWGNEWPKIYPGFKKKFRAACKRISDNARAEDPATTSRANTPARPYIHTIAHADIPSTSLDASDAGQRNRRRQPIRRARESQHKHMASSVWEELSTTSEDETTEEAYSDDIESSSDDSYSNTQSISSSRGINTGKAKSKNPRKRRRTKPHSDPDDADIEFLQIAEKSKTDMTRIHKKSKAKYEKAILELNTRIADLESQLAQVKSAEDRESASGDEINSHKAEIKRLREEAQKATMMILEGEAKRRNTELDLERAKTKAEQEEQKSHS